jgi:hypothetical protein
VSSSCNELELKGLKGFVGGLALSGERKGLN